ncbi:MAG: MSCRAMM family adhesin SdrC, partial [Chloroflexaceae bacterium]|nr:MSCRAMM family adhesin SdrC [Chloroflexaceae bacterium]
MRRLILFVALLAMVGLHLAGTLAGRSLAREASAGSSNSTALSRALTETATGKLGGRVFQDDNGNGRQDAGEPGISGVTVRLTRPGSDHVCSTSDDQFVASAATSANGVYSFENLAAGAYCVAPDQSTVPPGFRLTTNNVPISYNLAQGEICDVLDFGYQPRGTIGDRVWRDDNGNGLQDAGEPGTNGVRVVLRDPGPNGVCDPTDAALATAVTAGDGAYLFTGLAAGRYCVDVDETTVPAGLTLTTNNDPLLVNLGPGQSFLNADF